NLFADVGILAREFWRRAERHAEEVVHDENLSVAIRPGTDADRRNAQFTGNLRCQLAGQRFQDYGESARGLYCAGITQYLLRGVWRFPLHFVAAEGVDRLRRQTDVAHNGDFRFGEPRD